MRVTRPFDLSAPGAVDQLLAFHRSVFGDARMEDAPAAAPAAPPAAPAAPAPPANPAPAAPAAPPASPPAPQAPAAPQQPATDQQGRIEDLPEWAQTYIKGLRTENGDRRTRLTAAEQRQQEVLAAIAKAAGIEVPGQDTPPDPAALTQQLTESQRAQRDQAIELAVFRAATPAGVNVTRLTDSRSFMAKVQALDPAAADFADKVTAAITEATTADPSLKTGRAPGASTIDPAGGPGAGRTPIAPVPLGQAVSAHYGSA